MPNLPTQEQLRLDCTRSVSIVPTSYRDEDNSIEVTFSTTAGQRALKYDWWEDKPYVEDLPMSGMDLGELNQGAHVLRAHDTFALESVLGSVIPGTATIATTPEGQEARARVTLSREASDAEIVNKLRTGVIRRWSYGYRRNGKPTVTRDEATGYEVRTFASHTPYELSPVPVPADGFTSTRAATPATAESVNPSKREESMDTTKIETPAVQPEVNLDEVRAQAVREEAARQNGIRSAARKLGTAEAEVEALCGDPNISLDAARARMIDALAAKDAVIPTHPQVTILNDPDQTRVDGMVEALAHRTDGKTFALTDNGKRFRSYRLADYAREFLGPKGRELSDSEAFDRVLGQRAFLATSDFPALLANVAAKNFNAGQQRATRWFEGCAARRTVKDFKSVSEVKMTMPSIVPTLGESGEYTYTTVTDHGETWALVSKADITQLTRQALINDDTNALGTIPAENGWRCVRTENYMVASLLNANANLSDGKALFHADHSNITASGGGVPSTTEIAKGR